MDWGYDTRTRHLFSYGDEVAYEGRVEAADLPVKLAEEGPVGFDDRGGVCPLTEREAAWTGAHFLSGHTYPLCLNIYSPSADLVHRAITRYSEGGVRHVPMPFEAGLGVKVPICLSGAVCGFPDVLADFGRHYPHSSIYACPLIDELTALGALIEGRRRSSPETPRRLLLGRPNEGVLPFPSRPYEKKLGADAYGRMAFCISRADMPALNQVLDCVGLSPFYGRVLFKRDVFPADPVFLVKVSKVEDYFPHEPVSLRNYLASSCPVRLRNTDKFAEDAVYAEENVDVFCVTSVFPDILTFMNFAELFGEERIVASYDPKSVLVDNSIPVFRYNRVYSGIPELWFTREFSDNADRVVRQIRDT